ncbi:MAG: glycosyltransferase family 52 [Candidatus Electrothrix sp. Rat3]|nr:glycosyltransferase family 52 [Candidatus Electrothrix rattekaaiensis]
MVKLSTSLVLCRTPFQALLLKAVLVEENVTDYHLVYLTQDDSEEDHYYYNKLSENASQAYYLYQHKKKFDIFNHIEIYRKVFFMNIAPEYHKIFISSISSLALRKVASHYKEAEIISFDDGSGHINKHTLIAGRRPAIRMRVYEKLFRVPTVEKFKCKIHRHYSVYPHLDHIMPRDIIRYVNPFGSLKLLRSKAAGPTFFIGQPYPANYPVDKLMVFLREQKIDYYVKHPREAQPLVPDIPLLKKNGKIAEEAIFKTSKGKIPRIIGGFSSVLFNIPHDQAKKIMLVIKDDVTAKYYSELAIQAGCKVVFF